MSVCVNSCQRKLLERHVLQIRSSERSEFYVRLLLSGMRKRLIFLLLLSAVAVVNVDVADTAAVATAVLAWSLSSSFPIQLYRCHPSKRRHACLICHNIHEA